MVDPDDHRKRPCKLVEWIDYPPALTGMNPVVWRNAETNEPVFHTAAFDFQDTFKGWTIVGYWSEYMREMYPDLSEAAVYETTMHRGMYTHGLELESIYRVVLRNQK